MNYNKTCCGRPPIS